MLSDFKGRDSHKPTFSGCFLFLSLTGPIQGDMWQCPTTVWAWFPAGWR